MHARSSLRRRGLIAGLLVAAGAATATGFAVGSDHQDTPDVELNPRMDMTDVYVFPSATPGRIVLVMNSRAFLTPAQAADPVQGSFDPDLLYQFKIDNDNDFIEDQVVQVTFSGTGADQQVELRGPVAPPVEGAMMNEVADLSAEVTGSLGTALGSPTGIQLFAGPRDDPFFIDLEAAFCILPDRKPVSGELSAPCDLAGVPPFRPASEAVNYVAGFNVLSIVVELPSSLVENGAAGKLNIWGTISR
ncbi:MAG TPA: DUF4331 family protein [Gemmatimonadales bacterium]|nr:DUF4331 family protein [Gemmatimonadales bacterium]